MSYKMTEKKTTENRMECEGHEKCSLAPPQRTMVFAINSAHDDGHCLSSAKTHWNRVDKFHICSQSQHYNSIELRLPRNLFRSSILNTARALSTSLSTSLSLSLSLSMMGLLDIFWNQYIPCDICCVCHENASHQMFMDEKSVHRKNWKMIVRCM